MNMKKTMMYLPAEMHAYLADEAGRRGVSMAEIAREAITEYRTRTEQVPKRNYMAIVGIIDEPGPPSNDSQRIDELLDEYYAVGGGWDKEHGFVDSD
ncbi:MAG: ribbon-helix-helix domain-containing protein [Coriobacteriia bacterium]